MISATDGAPYHLSVPKGHPVIQQLAAMTRLFKKIEGIKDLFISEFRL